MFDTYLYPLLLGLAMALLGAWLSVMWPIWRDNKRYSREVDLLGDWLSSWQETADPNKWVTERVHISVKNGEVVLSNSDNSGGYEWDGAGELHDRRYFHGVWKSRKRAANSSGVLSFLVLPQGDSIVGQVFGPDREGRLYMFEMVLGKDPKALEEAKRWIGSHSTRRINAAEL